jgi:hypothetical protein
VLARFGSGGRTRAVASIRLPIGGIVGELVSEGRNEGASGGGGRWCGGGGRPGIPIGRVDCGEGSVETWAGGGG